MSLKGNIDLVEQNRLFGSNANFLGFGLPTKSFLCFPRVLMKKTLNGGFDLAKVKLRDGESQDKLLRRFRKAVIRSKVFGEVRRRRWFISKSEQRRIDKKKAIRRIKKKARMNQRYDK